MSLIAKSWELLKNYNERIATLSNVSLPSVGPSVRNYKHDMHRDETKSKSQKKEKRGDKDDPKICEWDRKVNYYWYRDLSLRLSLSYSQVILHLSKDAPDSQKVSAADGDDDEEDGDDDQGDITG